MSYSVTDAQDKPDSEIKIVELINIRQELLARLDYWIGQIMRNGGYGDISISLENAGKRQIITVSISDKVF